MNGTSGEFIVSYVYRFFYLPVLFNGIYLDEDLMLDVKHLSLGVV